MLFPHQACWAPRISDILLRSGLAVRCPGRRAISATSSATSLLGHGEDSEAGAYQTVGNGKRMTSSDEASGSKDRGAWQWGGAVGWARIFEARVRILPDRHVHASVYSVGQRRRSVLTEEQDFVFLFSLVCPFSCVVLASVAPSRFSCAFLVVGR